MSTQNLFMATFYLKRAVVKSAQIVTTVTFDFGALPAELRYRILSLVLDDSPIQLAPIGEQAFIPLNIRLVSKTFSADLIKVLETWTPPTDMTWRIVTGGGINVIHDHAQSIMHTLLSRYRPSTALTLARCPPLHHIELALFHPAAFAYLPPNFEYVEDRGRAALHWHRRRRLRKPNFSYDSIRLMRTWHYYMDRSRVTLQPPHIHLTLDLTLPRAARKLPYINRRFWDKNLHALLHDHNANAGPQGDRCRRCAGVTLVGTLRQEDWIAIETMLENGRRGFVRIAGGGLRLTGEDVPPPRRPREMSLGQLRVEVATVDTWVMHAIGVMVAVLALLLGLELISR